MKGESREKKRKRKKRGRKRNQKQEQKAEKAQRKSKRKQVRKIGEASHNISQHLIINTHQSVQKELLIFVCSVF